MLAYLIFTNSGKQFRGINYIVPRGLHPQNADIRIHNKHAKLPTRQSVDEEGNTATNYLGANTHRSHHYLLAVD